jgi:ABC-type multidrug transport system fused ATPase/permease subunit
MNSLLDFIDCSLSAIQIVSVIGWFIPWLFVAMFPVVLFAFWISRQYLIVSRELKRLENIKKSPVFVLFSETLNGLAVIRAFREESRFFHTCCTHIDAMNKCHIYLWISNRWLNFRVELCGAVVSFSVGAAIVYLVGHHPNSMSATAAGLSLMYSLTFCDSLNWTARTHANVGGLV